MGKASRRPRRERPERPVPASFVARPFEGLPGETEWVAMREILPAATAQVRFTGGDADPVDVAVSTVLPLAWPAWRGEDGTRYVSVQIQPTGGDIGRDVAEAMRLVADAAEGDAVPSLPVATDAMPRLQDVVDTSRPLRAELRDGFDFWAEGADLDDESRESLERANSTVIPTTRIESAPTVFWCEIGGRAYVRWVLPADEDAATNALARLHAAGRSPLEEGARLLGCFRTSGLLVPVWEVDPERDAESFTDPVAAMSDAIDEQLAGSTPLTPEERRARAGLLNRQITLR